MQILCKCNGSAVDWREGRSHTPRSIVGLFRCNGAAVVFHLAWLAQTLANRGCCIPLALRRVERVTAQE